MISFAPSLLSADFSRLGSEIKQVEVPGVEFLHLDIMDGNFVPNITFGPDVVKSLRPLTKIKFDAHLMINKPENFITAFAEAGVDYITVHAEGNHHLHRLLTDIREHGVKAAVALNPSTPLSAIDWVLPELDMVLLMSVNPGFGGQKFIPGILTKIKQLKQMIDSRGLAIPIQVDGGINTETAPLAVKAGAQILVAGSAIFGQGDIKQAVNELRQSIS
ncbi:MAG: ribulose-phosphate 3-epimerase [Bacillota bacterium]